METRRKFLRDCSLVAATASLVPTATVAQNYTARMAAPKGLGLEQFARQVKTSFIVRRDSNRIKLLLVEARAFSSATPYSEDARNEKFSLLFWGPAEQPLEQGAYLFEHPRMGRQEIFIVPVGYVDTAQCCYEAIFNRPINSVELDRQRARAPKRIQKA